MIELRILSPSALLLSEDVTEVELPGAAGRFVVLKDHDSLISTLVRGEIRYRRQDASEGSVAVASGFVEVKDNKVCACIEQ